MATTKTFEVFYQGANSNMIATNINFTISPCNIYM